MPIALGFCKGPLDIAAEQAAKAGLKDEAKELREMRDRVIDMEAELR